MVPGIVVLAGFQLAERLTRIGTMLSFVRLHSSALVDAVVFDREHLLEIAEFYVRVGKALSKPTKLRCDSGSKCFDPGPETPTRILLAFSHGPCPKKDGTLIELALSGQHTQ